MASNHFPMRTRRAPAASNLRRFGRARAFQLPVSSENRLGLSDEVQLFAATFAAGFIFVSILIG